ncbi:DsbA family protein [Halorussus halophilus]|uniref:DsbA family protein n=1 Tax=Halorussus halophilus TaxID=2650975 RepID=UPI001300D563|nr:thioredoxin domain-containing protein [Halorussus halophilus]
MTNDNERFDRRAFLAATASASVLLAGCSGDDGADSTTTGGTSGTTVGSIGTTRGTTSTRKTTSTDGATTEATQTTNAETATSSTETQTTAGTETTTDAGTTTETQTTSQPTTTTTTSGKRRKPQFSFTANHASASGLGRQPYLGDPPSQTGKVVVMYQDMSCSVCRDFEFGAFQKLRSKRIVSGDVTFVVRDYPHVDNWTYPATTGLESTYDRNPEMYWPLRHHVYEEQSSFTMENVYDRIESLLRANTSVNPDAVVEDMAEGAYKPTLQADLKNRKQASVSGTPTFFLFDGATLVDRLEGNVEYEAFGSLF